MRSLSQRLSAVILSVAVCVRWFQEQLWVPLAEWWIDTVLGTWEESIKTFIREFFSNATRVVNGFFSWVVAALPHDRSIAKKLRTKISRSQAWQSWWREERPSTFNAIVAQEAPPGRNASANGDRAHANGGWSPTKSRSRRHGRGASKQRQGLFGWSSRAVAHTSAAVQRSLQRIPLVGRWFGGGKKRSQKGPSLRRRGSDLFDRPSGWAVSESVRRRGFVEEMRLDCELAVTAIFDSVRWLVRRTLRVPPPESPALRGLVPSVIPEASLEPEGASVAYRSQRLRRSTSFSAYETLHGVWTAKDVIQSAGYPMEPHIVTTSDGYIMQMERIPRRGARDVVFFMHGILDTSMGWVCNGVTGSNAFAAYDAGFDVWLGNSRANPPRLHMDPSKQGARYWHYSVNELGMEDVAAQIDHIHIIKTTELTAAHIGADGTRNSHAAAADALLRNASHRLSAGNNHAFRKMRRSNSESGLNKLQFSGTTSSEPYAAQGLHPPNEASFRAARTFSGQHAQDGVEGPQTPRQSSGSRKQLSGGVPTRSRKHNGSRQQAFATPPNSAREAQRASQWSPWQSPQRRGRHSLNGSAAPHLHRPVLETRSADQALKVEPNSVEPSRRLDSHPVDGTASEEEAAEVAKQAAALLSSPEPSAAATPLEPVSQQARQPQQIAGGKSPAGNPAGAMHSLAAASGSQRAAGTTSDAESDASWRTPVASDSDDTGASFASGGSNSASPARSRGSSGSGGFADAVSNPFLVKGGSDGCLPNGYTNGSQFAGRGFTSGSGSDSDTPRVPARHASVPLSQAAGVGSPAAGRQPRMERASGATQLTASPHGATVGAASGRAGGSGVAHHQQLHAAVGVPQHAGRHSLEARMQPSQQVDSPSPPRMHPDLTAVTSAESRKRLTPDRESIGGTEARPRAETHPPLHPAGRQRDQRRAQWAGQEADNGKAEAAPPEKEPYRLRAVGHSLGGASLLVYAAMCGRTGRPHHIHRLILLTPAGFLKSTPWTLWPFTVAVPPLARLVDWLYPGRGAAAYVPSSLLRYLTFKVFVDLQQIPALNELTLAGIRMLLGGDTSQWDRALQMPHYNARAMPAFSFRTGVHLIQWARSGRFTLFDYGSAAANRQHYGQATPPDVAADYRLLDCPVDICAGRADGVISKENVLLHYEAMRKAGTPVTYKEFDFGHLDFTFAVKDELRHYVLSRLLLRS